jgi:hypothetical protein
MLSMLNQQSTREGNFIIQSGWFYPLPEIRKRQCSFPKINRAMVTSSLERLFWGRGTALPIGVNLRLKPLINLAFNWLSNPLASPAASGGRKIGSVEGILILLLTLNCHEQGHGAVSSVALFCFSPIRWCWFKGVYLELLFDNLM